MKLNIANMILSTVQFSSELLVCITHADNFSVLLLFVILLFLFEWTNLCSLLNLCILYAHFVSALFYLTFSCISCIFLYFFVAFLNVACGMLTRVSRC